jgi:hypothetical protein
VRGEASGQHVHPFFFVNLSDITNLVILGSSFREPPTEIEHSRLAELELELSREVGCSMREQARPVEVRVGGGVILFFQEESDYTDVDCQSVF